MVCLIVSVKHSVTTEQLCEMRGSVHHAATYHPKGLGSCLSKFQNMKPVNRKRISLSGSPAERSDQELKILNTVWCK